MESRKTSEQKSNCLDLSSSDKPSSSKMQPTDCYSTRTGSLSHVRARPPPAGRHNYMHHGNQSVNHSATLISESGACMMGEGLQPHAHFGHTNINSTLNVSTIHDGVDTSNTQHTINHI